MFASKGENALLEELLIAVIFDGLPVDVAALPHEELPLLKLDELLLLCICIDLIF